MASNWQPQSHNPELMDWLRRNWHDPRSPGRYDTFYRWKRIKAELNLPPETRLADWLAKIGPAPDGPPS